MKKFTLCLLAALLLVFLAACGGGKGKDSGKTASPFDAALPENFTVSVDLKAVASVENASVITGKKLIIDPDAAADTLMLAKAEQTPIGPGCEYRSTYDVFKDLLICDMTGEYGDADRKTLGGVAYKRTIAAVGFFNGVDRLTETIFLMEPIYKDILTDLLSNEDLPDLSCGDARQKIESYLDKLNLPLDDSSGYKIEPFLTYRLDVESQEYYLANPEGIKGLPTQSLTDERKNSLSDGFAFWYRQYIDGIPLNHLNWLVGVSDDFPGMQSIYGCYSVNGAMTINVGNIIKSAERGEQKPLISFEEAYGNLLDIYSNTIMTRPERLVDAELCYAIFNTEDVETIKLYPIWVFVVRVSEKEGPNYDSYKAYAFDAFTGERIVGNAMPKS